MRKILDVLDLFSGILWKIILLINKAVALVVVAVAKTIISIFVYTKETFNIRSKWIINPIRAIYIFLDWLFEKLSIVYNGILKGITKSLILKRVVFIVVISLWLNFMFQPLYWFNSWRLYQSGIASYYGPGFYFNRTANGDIYWPWCISAASLSLPLGTIAKVVNRDNGDFVYVTITDRGPYVHGRILDLSPLAAFKLGMIQKGIVPVDIYVAN